MGFILNIDYFVWDYDYISSDQCNEEKYIDIYIND